MFRVQALAGNRASKTGHYLQWWDNKPEWNAMTSGVVSCHHSSLSYFLLSHFSLSIICVSSVIPSCLSFCISLLCRSFFFLWCLSTSCCFCSLTRSISAAIPPLLSLSLSLALSLSLSSSPFLSLSLSVYLSLCLSLSSPSLFVLSLFHSSVLSFSLLILLSSFFLRLLAVLFILFLSQSFDSFRSSFQALLLTFALCLFRNQSNWCAIRFLSSVLHISLCMFLFFFSSWWLSTSCLVCSFICSLSATLSLFLSLSRSLPLSSLLFLSLSQCLSSRFLFIFLSPPFGSSFSLFQILLLNFAQCLYCNP